MNRSSLVIGALCLQLIACLALFGCNDAGFTINPTSSTPGGAGIVKTVPQIGGAWLADARITSNSCGSLAGIPPDEMDLTIRQTDTFIAIDLVDPCEGTTETATGHLTADNVLTAFATSTESASQKCTLETVSLLTAITDDEGSRIEGSVVVDVTASFGCGSGFPCSYELTLDADRCPDSGCLQVACPASTD